MSQGAEDLAVTRTFDVAHKCAQLGQYIPKKPTGSELGYSTGYVHAVSGASLRTGDVRAFAKTSTGIPRGILCQSTCLDDLEGSVNLCLGPAKLGFP